jgi:hypothetical protein
MLHSSSATFAAEPERLGLYAAGCAAKAWIWCCRNVAVPAWACGYFCMLKILEVLYSMQYAIILQYEQGFLSIRHAIYKYAGMCWYPLARSPSKCMSVLYLLIHIYNIADE